MSTQNKKAFWANPESPIVQSLIQLRESHLEIARDIDSQIRGMAISLIARETKGKPATILTINPHSVEFLLTETPPEK